MPWLLFLTLPRLGGSVPVFPAPLPPAPDLQEAEVPIVRTRACERMYHKCPTAHGQVTIIKAAMPCAGRKGQGSCQGDAGTPRSVTGWTPGSRLAC
nr:tryptase-like [Pan troglodytes]